MSERVGKNIDQLFANEALFDATLEALFVQYRRCMAEPTDTVYSDVKAAAQTSKSSFRQIAEYTAHGDDEIFEDDADHSRKLDYFSGLLAGSERRFRDMVASGRQGHSEFSQEEWFELADGIKESLASTLENTFLDEEDPEYEEFSDVVVNEFDDLLVAWNDHAFTIGVRDSAGQEEKLISRKKKVREVAKIALSVALGAWLAETLRRGDK